MSILKMLKLPASSGVAKVSSLSVTTYTSALLLASSLSALPLKKAKKSSEKYTKEFAATTLRQGH
jgi:hypothetical protein